MTSSVRRRLGHVCRAAGAPALLLLLSSCGGAAPSTLSPAGVGARRVAGLWWLLFGISVVVAVLVALLLAWVMARRTRAGVHARTGSGRAFVVTMGVVLPAIVLAFVYAVGLRDLRDLAVPRDPHALVIEVVGHQWWWEVRYPASGFVTANEIHVPTGSTVRLRLSTADVNHSFWVPQLAVKTDLIAGRVNEMWLRAEHDGVYRGQCAEYCGLQHGHMAVHVIAQPAAEFASWLAGQARPAAVPAGGAPARGLRVLEASSCAACHTVRGTRADGKVGPDLTHVGGRRFLAAGAIPNTPGYLGGWISDSQSIKPGNAMPPQPLAPEDLRSLIAYLGTLR
ncbi:cytochrome c oxidase subunit II [Microtetraspora fusca]|uniref:cytochrome-c oxidase n=1 Tax=Microtetraspora fusca TaxID=1997 RepID=A0ABW6VD76_MICFU